MANNFYNHGAYPAQGSAGTSAAMRSELDSIAAAFDKLPQLTGNALKAVIVNAGETGLTTTSLTLGTIAQQNANNVSISGGSITGITDLAVADGGTGASNATDARTNLGLGAAATQSVPTGIVLGNGTAFSAASAGTDYAKPDTASSWTANQTYDTGKLIVKGSSTGVTDFSSANAGASNYTVTIPASSTTVLISSYAHTLSGPTAARTFTLPDASVSLGYKNIPAVGTQTGSYSLATTDVGKYVQVGSGGSITIPDATFAEGDVVSVINNTTAGITITCTITNAYIAGTDTDKATMTLATRGVATIFFLSGTACVVTGNVS